MGPCVDFRVDSGSGFAERDEPGGVRRLRRRGYNPSALGGDGGTEWWSLQRRVDMKIRPHLAIPERAGSITGAFKGAPVTRGHPGAGGGDVRLGEDPGRPSHPPEGSHEELTQRLPTSCPPYDLTCMVRRVPPTAPEPRAHGRCPTKRQGHRFSTSSDRSPPDTNETV